MAFYPSAIKANPKLNANYINVVLIKLNILGKNNCIAIINRAFSPRGNIDVKHKMAALINTA